ncbi:MAG: protein phosphatase 2C domain-containing protein, partial [Anaerolineales bacterium]|nr:protein phosphatase 2C domain-containing protein [Anaerolineales bacterium]
MDGAIIFGKPAQIGLSTNKGARDKRNDDRSAAFTGTNESGQPVQYLVVADGVTSTHGGDQASDIAVQQLQKLLQSPGDRPVSSRIVDAIQAANQAIVDAAAQNPEFKGMSTTLVLAAIEGNWLYVMHLGDSRAYLVRGTNIYQLTLDHTWVQEAIDEGRITREQATVHPNRHVIKRYLGVPGNLNIDGRILAPAAGATAAPRQWLEFLTLEDGDALLLCSDGVYGRIDSAEIMATVRTNLQRPQRATDQLIGLALKRQEPDNITALLLTTGGGDVAAVGAPWVKWALAAAFVVLVMGAASFLGCFVHRRKIPSRSLPPESQPESPPLRVTWVRPLPSALRRSPVRRKKSPWSPRRRLAAPPASPSASPSEPPAATSTPLTAADATASDLAQAPASATGSPEQTLVETATTGLAAGADGSLTATSSQTPQAGASSSATAQPARIAAAPGRGTPTPLAATSTPLPSAT